jgi:hypothetical protein
VNGPVKDRLGSGGATGKRARGGPRRDTGGRRRAVTDDEAVTPPVADPPPDPRGRRRCHRWHPGWMVRFPRKRMAAYTRWSDRLGNDVADVDRPRKAHRKARRKSTVPIRRLPTRKHGAPGNPAITPCSSEYFVIKLTCSRHHSSSACPRDTHFHDSYHSLTQRAAPRLYLALRLRLRVPSFPMLAKAAARIKPRTSR